MSAHRFAVGSVVALDVENGAPARHDRYIVEAQMPVVGSDLQYRIKSADEDFRRVAVERQLKAFEAESAPTVEPERKPLPGEED